MRPFLTKLRVWLPPPLILVLFLIADALTAIPRFTFGAWSRNPIYLGMSGLQLAFSLYVGSLIGILAAPLFILVVARLHIDFEEEQLRKHFGPEWIRYEQRVRRWL